MAPNRSSASKDGTSTSPPQQASEQQNFSPLDWTETRKRGLEGSSLWMNPKRAKTDDASSDARIAAVDVTSAWNIQSSSSSDTACMVCGKTFMSSKAMHGHMRCHPERLWRGIKPPRKITVPNPSTTINLASPFSPPPTPPPLASDQQNPSPPNCPITGIRGRQEKTPLSSLNIGGDGDHQDSSIAPDVLFGACNLFRLHYGYDHPSYTPAVLTTSLSSPAAGPNPTNTDSQEINTTNQSVEIEEETEAKKTYECSICSKSFASHQALGGHTASHNKNNREATETGAAKVSEHRCKVCQEVYPSGQALGGHMRKHYQGTLLVTSEVPQLINSEAPLPINSEAALKGNGSSDETRVVVLGFDLNVTAPMEDD